MIIKVVRQSVKQLISSIDTLEVYKFYMPYKFEVGKATFSPFRKENNPSFLISRTKGQYYHIDFADDRYHGDCVNFVMQMFDITLNEAIIKIHNDLNLIAVTNKEDIKQERKVIQIVNKPFTKQELDYWKSYHITEEELKKDNVYSVKRLFIDKKESRIKNEMVFGYLYDNKYWKIYQPGENRRNKWISSVPISYVDGLDTLADCDKLIVTKAKKDKIIFNKFMPACSVQNESLYSLTEQSVEKIKKKAKEVYICFDSDDAGVKASWQITSKYGFKHINVPYSYLKEKIKDFSDMVKKYGLKSLEDYLKYKRLI